MGNLRLGYVTCLKSHYHYQVKAGLKSRRFDPGSHALNYYPIKIEGTHSFFFFSCYDFFFLEHGSGFSVWWTSPAPRQWRVLPFLKQDFSPWARRRFQLDNSLLWGAALYIIVYLTASLASIHEMPVAPPSKSWQQKLSPDITICPLKVSGAQNHALLRTSGLKK